MKTYMSCRLSGAALSLLGAVLAIGCVSGSDGEEAGPYEAIDGREQPVNACVGDDLNYDFNAFAASLAVAVANELGRWDATADFEVRNGKLELSTTGWMRCAGACPNVTALLRLQDDAASEIPNHSPWIYRSKLATWHAAEVQKLTELVNKMLYLDKGIYRIKARHSGKYMTVDGGSFYDNAAIEQRGYVPNAGSDQWRVVLEGTKHRLINVRSGKCLTLSTDGTVEGPLIQRTCAATSAQQFDFAQVNGYFAIRSNYGLVLDVEGASLNEDARVLHYLWTGSSNNQQWTLEPFGTGAHVDPVAMATAVYSITARHSGQALAVEYGGLWAGAVIEQQWYSASDDKFHWYVFRNGGQYQLVNRRSGKCMGLQWDAWDAPIAQKVCNGSDATQSFTMSTSGDGYRILYTKHGRTLEVMGASTGSGADIGQGSGNWDANRQFLFKPLLAGEPHSLVFAYTTPDAACGEYNYWYNIVKPNGQPLDFPQDTYVQLIFAGGKQTATGTDINPFIAQQIRGNLVAIDPTSGLTEGGTTTSGSCQAACSKYSTAIISGQCCSCNGVMKRFVRSTFSPNIYACKG